MVCVIVFRVKFQLQNLTLDLPSKWFHTQIYYVNEIAEMISFFSALQRFYYIKNPCNTHD